MTADAKAPYNILILSPIAIFEANGVFFAMDLWARDLEAQARVAGVDLLCPVAKSAAQGTALDPAVRVHSSDAVTDNELIRLVSNVDVVQLPGNAGWRDSGLSRRLVRIAKKLGKRVVLGVSSNRARTAWLNARNGFVGAIKYIDVRTSQVWLSVRSDGVFVVGEGLRELFAKYNSNVFVGTASWIRQSEIAPLRRRGLDTFTLCMASRIEKMKGMHIGVAAVELARTKCRSLRLLIIGEGPEKQNLRQQVAGSDLASITTFKSPVSYPQPFLAVLAETDVVLMTNLNDEQPRLIFDAISQGCLPICPDTKAYRSFGLDDHLFYRQGDAVDLSRVIKSLCDIELREKLCGFLPSIAARYTIDEMHRNRSLWIAKTLGMD